MNRRNGVKARIVARLTAGMGSERANPWFYPRAPRSGAVPDDGLATRIRVPMVEFFVRTASVP